MLAKPEPMVLHRPHHHGGLGLHSVKYKAMAGLITTFLQTAANPAYQQNLLHSLLYKKHILCEDIPSAPNPPPPYFSQTIFDVIRKVKEDSPLNILPCQRRTFLGLSNGSNEVYVQTTFPDSFVQHNRLVRVEHTNSSFKINSSQTFLVRNSWMISRIN